MIKHTYFLLLLTSLFACSKDHRTTTENTQNKVWAAQQANQWYDSQPWLVGCNFIPSTAINELEMWQAATFDTATINRELGYAQGIGFNTARVFLHNLVWETDSTAFKDRINTFLTIADKHHIKPLFVLFDDCWNPNPQPGKQPDPKPGIHNSGWMQAPGHDRVNDSTTWHPLERYVKDILTTFGHDSRVLMWDLYNEPGNSDEKSKTLPLLSKVFEWAHEVRPDQPLSAGLWADGDDFKALNDFQVANSDVITFHNYNDSSNLRKEIIDLQKYGRPIICTEYMARTRDSRFMTHLPVFKKYHVAAINWGLVSGKTNTIYPWGSPGGEPEPKIWFHDIFRPDGTPFDKSETDFIRSITDRH